MATELQGFDVSLKVNADFSAKQFFIVKMSTTARTVALGAAATDKLIGIMQDAPTASGKIGTVRVSGLSKISAGGTFAAGDALTSDAAGEAVKADPAAGVNNGQVGIALEAAVDGDIVTCLLQPGNIQTSD